MSQSLLVVDESYGRSVFDITCEMPRSQKKKMHKNVKNVLPNVLTFTCPPLVLSREPARMLWPVLIPQCAAVNIVQESRIVPPQNWILPDNMATCHGIILGAASPPTIRLNICIKVGIEAKDKIIMRHQKSIEFCISFIANRKSLILTTTIWYWTRIRIWHSTKCRTSCKASHSTRHRTRCRTN